MPQAAYHPPFQVAYHVKATLHLTISMRGQSATGTIQRNNYYHGSSGLL